MNRTKKTILIAFIVGAIAGLLSSSIIPNEPSHDELIKLYYETEAATLVSPHHLRGEMDKGHDDFILVDLRTKEEYELEHVIGAINIPANLPQSEFIETFSKLEKENPRKHIIVYCYSAACLTGRKAGRLLAQNDIFVQEMSVGWNDWRYDWEAWNYPDEWADTDVMDYIHSGPEPGQLSVKKSKACPIEGSLSC